MIHFACPSCGAKLRVPDDKAGKQGHCPKCGGVTVAPSSDAAPPEPNPPAEPPAARAGEGAGPTPETESPPPTPPDQPQVVKLVCDGCGAHLSVPASAIGTGENAARTGQCPRCKEIIQLPPVDGAAGGEEEGGPSPFDLAGGDMGDLVALEAAPTDEAATAVAHEPTTYRLTGDGPICPSCQKQLPPDARICGRCGVRIPSGRPLVVSRTFDEDEDWVHIRAGQIIKWISWVFWSGIYPIHSSAAGRSRPYVTWAVLVVTLLASVWFWGLQITASDHLGWMKNWMLWTGDRRPAAQTLYQWYVPPSFGDWRAFQESLRRVHRESPQLSQEESVLAAHEALPPEDRATGEYRSLQLLTHALLHAGLLHLAANMVFLLVLGGRVNAAVGNLPMIVLYPLLAVCAGLIYRETVAGQTLMPMLGASGAIMGLAGVYLVLFPLQKVYMAFWWRWGLWMGFRLHYKIFAVWGFVIVGAYIAIDVLFLSLGVQSGTAHWAHLGGFLAGVGVGVLLLICRLVYTGSDVLSLLLGRFAWPLVGTPAWHLNRRAGGDVYRQEG